MTTIWRLNIKPDAQKDVDPRKFCLERNILGVGWQVDADSPLTKETYCHLGREEHLKKMATKDGGLPSMPFSIE